MSYSKLLFFNKTSGLLLYRFVLPPFLTLKNFEGLDLGKMDEVSGNHNVNLLTCLMYLLRTFTRNFEYWEQANDSGLASYVAGQIDRTLSWKVQCSPIFFVRFFCSFYKIIKKRELVKPSFSIKIMRKK